MMSITSKQRCFGNKPGQEYLADYHDNEWGIPIFDDKKLFEYIVLEGAQAGLNWNTILQKRLGYSKAFFGFDPLKVAHMSDAELNALINNPSIIRNKLKIYSARNNAQVFLKIKHEFGSFSNYIWQFVNNKPIKNHWQSLAAIPATTKESDVLSKELKFYGMKFVGSTIIYAFMQAVGMVNDHLVSCCCYKN